MLIQTANRAEFIEALINVWLSDKSKKCIRCGKYFFEGDPPCCEEPYYGNNGAELRQFLKELEVVKQTRKNKYASLDDKSMRFGVSMPQSLYLFLEKVFRDKYEEPLFNDEYNAVWFAKKFPVFAVPEEI